jgi:hypothetical protein
MCQETEKPIFHASRIVFNCCPWCGSGWRRNEMRTIIIQRRPLIVELLQLRDAFNVWDFLHWSATTKETRWIQVGELIIKQQLVQTLAYSWRQGLVTMHDIMSALSWFFLLIEGRLQSAALRCHGVVMAIMRRDKYTRNAFFYMSGKLQYRSHNNEHVDILLYINMHKPQYQKQQQYVF